MSSSSKKRIAVLGSSGSIGRQTLDVAEKHSDKIEVVALSVHSQIPVLEDQARAHQVFALAIGNDNLIDDPRLDSLKDHLDSSAHEYSGLHFGQKGLLELVHHPEVDIVVNALVGAAGLRASFEALKAGKVLALANKESLVVGGDIIMPLATHDTLLPIDSEHGAIYQCLLGEDKRVVSKLWVTASGGPFYGQTRESLVDITPEKALAHPTWNMGPKITIDSSTLMNKGLEVIEAHHLFDMSYKDIEVVVQRQSAIHSMVEFSDGSVKAHLGTTDMRIPIQFALSYPERWDAPVAPLDFRELGTLDFGRPDTETFRCLGLAFEAGNTGGTLPCVMNAANEVAVEAFLHNRCSYLDIAACVESVMNEHESSPVENIEHLEAIDAWARRVARKYVS